MLQSMVIFLQLFLLNREENKIEGNIVFYIIAGLTVGSALCVVTVKNLFHCALFLVLSFFGVAGLYILLEAEFLAAVQVLIYVGAITVLILFGIMLTHKIYDKTVRQTSNQKFVSFLVVFGILLLILPVIINSFEGKFLPEHFYLSISELGKFLMREYLLPFEVVSVVLLASLIGAIVIATKDEPL